jgi:hypothetical protein
MDKHIFTKIPFELAVTDIAKELRVDESMMDEFREILDSAVRVADPKMIYRRVGVSLEGECDVVMAGVRFTSKVLSVNLEGVDAAFPYVATSGHELYDYAMSLSDPLERYWADFISERILHSSFKNGIEMLRLREGTGTLYAMNPGSLPDWPISQQRPLFELLGGVTGDIHVRLGDTFLMTPIKSVSGLFFEANEHYTNCSLCPREGCVGRREPFNPELAREKYGLDGEAQYDVMLTESM